MLSLADLHSSAQQFDVETQTPGGFIVVEDVVMLAADDLVAIGYLAGFAEQAMVLRMTNGTIQWSKLLLDTSLFFNGSRIHDVTLTSNGDILLAGGESRAGLFMSWVARLDADGSLLWSTSLNLNEDIADFHAIVEADDGTIYAVGRSGMGLQRNESVARFNAAGGLLWMRDLPYAGSQYATHALWVSGTLLVLGSTTIGAGARDIALFRYAPDGTLLSFRTYGSGANESPSSFLADGGGGHVITYGLNSTQGGILRIDAGQQPVAPPLILASPWGLNVSGRALWDVTTEEVLLMGQASNATDWFSMAVRVSLQSGVVVWDRSFPGTGFVTSCDAFGNEGHISCTADDFNGNGSYPAHIIKLDLLTGEEVMGVPCELPIPLDPFTFAGSIATIDHTMADRVLSPTVFSGIHLQDLPLMVNPCLSGSLPLELIQWKGFALPDGNLLTWTTGWERDNARFTIEHSIDHTQWNAIGQVSGQGFSGSPTEYRWSHHGVGPGVHYYRLQQTDLDGGSTGSPVITVTRTQASYPRLLASNPVAPGQPIDFAEEVMILDLAGRLIAGASLSLTTPLQPGIYLVMGHDRAERLVVQ